MPGGMYLLSQLELKPKIGGSKSRLAWAKSQIPSQKLKRKKGLEVWLKQQSACLPGSNPTTIKIPTTPTTSKKKQDKICQ
jgi:hypothetical protein